MERSTFAQQNVERAIELANFGLTWNPAKLRGASIEPEQSCIGRVTEGIQ